MPKADSKAAMKVVQLAALSAVLASTWVALKVVLKADLMAELKGTKLVVLKAALKAV